MRCGSTNPSLIDALTGVGAPANTDELNTRFGVAYELGVARRWLAGTAANQKLTS